jgi:TolB-like protein/Tfp pilus assembly protein PilF
MIESNSAIFLSHASEDAEAAQRIVASLRAAGIEVWLDQSELKGGDAWDAEIRRQIKACALFVPLISRNTQARAEGYFRLEWKLAVDRSHLIAADKAFLLPVVIDGIRELEARVPDKFREVQWIALPAGDTSPDFVGRIRRLISPAEPGMPAPGRASAGGINASGAQSGIASNAGVPEKSIAVLPFVDMSAQRDQEYFSDGLAEALIDLLTQVRDLRVPARTSSFCFKGKPDDIASIAAKLRVAHVLEGSVRRAGNLVRITAHLIRADNGYHLWSKTYDRNLEDIFKVQDEIAGIVVEALKARLLPPDGVVNAHRTVNPEAYEQFLLAKQFYNRRTIDSSQRAASALQRALALDPAYASAHALLANTIAAQVVEAGDPQWASTEQAVVAAERAVSLAPGLGEAYSARNYVRFFLQWDWQGAQADIEKALELDPRSFGARRRFAVSLGVVGRFTEAIAAAHAATEIEPLDVTAWAILGWCYAASGQFASAHRALSRALELSPDSTLATLWMAQCELAAGQTARALATNVRQQREPWRWCTQVMVEHTLGHAEESQRVMDELIAKYDHRVPCRIAVAYAWRGETDAAFDWLERAHRERDPMLGMLHFEPGLCGARSDPRYAALRRKMNLTA